MMQGLPKPCAAHIDVEHLVARIEELEEENRQLKQALAPAISWPHVFQLTPREGAFLAALYLRAPRTVHRDLLYTAIWGSQAVCEKSLDIYAYKVRGRLAPFKIDILTARGSGYALPLQSAAILRSMVEGAVE